MRQLSRISLACAVAALAISPAHAVELPRAAAPVAKTYAARTVLNDGADEADHGRRYRRHRDNGIDAGNVIAGALIIGGIFAVASAVDSSNKRDDRYDQDYQSNADFDRAVDACVNRVGRDERVGSVDNVGRTRTGYSVSGTLASGNSFSCRVSANGRVSDVDYGYGGVTYQSGGQTYGDPQYSSSEYSDVQYSDETYARARSDTYSQRDPYSQPDSYSTPDSNAQPAYPGGPVPGQVYEDYDEGSDDGYGTAEPY
ncbi:hypothetical protein [Citromicrobium bathyomarinum]|uniref:hypothetical protein n=1 Tax=Citromicrobium bathyomarinum TaxID=72174 RepID=UPI00315A6EE7